MHVILDLLVSLVLPVPVLTKSFLSLNIYLLGISPTFPALTWAFTLTIDSLLIPLRELHSLNQGLGDLFCQGSESK